MDMELNKLIKLREKLLNITTLKNNLDLLELKKKIMIKKNI
jgi:hypothetical protein